MASTEKIMFRGTGRRKSSIARVRIVAGNGNITINKKIKEESKKYKIPKAYNVQSTEKILRNNGFSRYNKNK